MNNPRKDISVVIPTYNPDYSILNRAIDSLSRQTLSPERFEVVLIDNRSAPAVQVEALTPAAASRITIVAEPQSGLTYARITGIKRSSGRYIVFVDDDNVLDPNYLERAITLGDSHPDIGAFGGRVLPEFAVTPPHWVASFYRCLALRDLGDEDRISTDTAAPLHYPDYAPIGAGMVLRRSVADDYAHTFATQDGITIPDRTGAVLSSGGDNDIVLSVLSSSNRVAYFSALSLTHLISADRLTARYLARINQASSRSWVSVLNKWGIRPWPAHHPALTFLRKAKAFLKMQPWRGAENYIRWSGACGILEGQADISRLSNSSRNIQTSFFKSIGAGRAVYLCYYRPRSFLRELRRRGALDWLRDISAEHNMMKAARSIAPYSSDKSSTFEVHILSGHRWWHQTCLCLYTLKLHTDGKVRGVIYDDGSLNDADLYYLKRALPDTRVVTAEQIDDRLNRFLPQSLFPVLRSRRIEYPHLRKITDIHCGSEEWRLVLDSDMLFFNRPEYLLHWLKNPTTPLVLQDVETSYGYSETLMERLTGKTIPPRVNVGFCGLNGADLPWSKLERWCGELQSQEGTHYTQEQALIAMHLSCDGFNFAPPLDYVVMPDRQEVCYPAGVLHHYVSDSKSLYLRNAVPLALERLAQNGEESI